MTGWDFLAIWLPVPFLGLILFYGPTLGWNVSAQFLIGIGVILLSTIVVHDIRRDRS